MKNYFLFLLVFIITSCEPYTKDNYLKEYDEFIEGVIHDNKNYSDEDWVKTNNEYIKYSQKLKNKFKEEFTWKDLIVLKKYDIEYNIIYFKHSSNDMFKNFNTLKEQLKYYKEHDMEKDIEFILKQANDIGGSTQKTIEELLEELGIDNIIKNQ